MAKRANNAAAAPTPPPDPPPDPAAIQAKADAPEWSAWLKHPIIVGVLLAILGSLITGTIGLVVKTLQMEHQVKALEADKVDSLALENHLSDLKSDVAALKTDNRALLMSNQLHTDTSVTYRNELNLHLARLEELMKKVDDLSKASAVQTSQLQDAFNHQAELKAVTEKIQDIQVALRERLARLEALGVERKQ